VSVAGTKGTLLVLRLIEPVVRGADVRVACFALLLGCGYLVNPAVAQLGTPTTSRAATAPAAQVEQWFGELADTDPAVRGRARTNLMGLSTADLPTLAAAVRAARPIGPEQAASLRDVVMQVYLAGLAYDPVPDAEGFLGVSGGDPVARPWQDESDLGPRGVQIVSRKPGFCGYRFLQDGDVLLNAEGVGPPAFRTFTDLSRVVSATEPGRSLRLRVLRAGHELTVELRPDLKPLVARQPLRTAFDAMLQERQSAFDAYWQQTFAPLLGESLS